MQMCPSDERSDMKFVLSLQRDKEHIIVCHFHGVYRHSCVHGTEQSEVVDVPCAYCSIMGTGDDDFAILDYFDCCYWAPVMV